MASSCELWWLESARWPRHGDALAARASLNGDLFVARTEAAGLPPLIWVRGKQGLALAWEPAAPGGWTARIAAQPGDYGALVNAAYLSVTGQTWEAMATAGRRWAETGCDAYQLRDCLTRTAQRIAPTRWHEIAVMAWRVRPRVTATVWTGPPEARADDRRALEMLLAERGRRIICGDTTAQIAAHLLGRPLRVDQALAHEAGQEGADGVPPPSYLEGVDLVTEGLVTLRRAADWLMGPVPARDLPRSANAAARLAHLLMSADEIHFVVGRARNPAQATEADAPRLPLVEALAQQLAGKGKSVRITRL